MWLPFTLYRAAFSRQSCRSLPSDPESCCLGGHGTCLLFFWSRNTTRPLAGRISLKSSDFDDVRLSHTVPTHSPPTLYPIFLASLLCARLPFICCHSVFVWTLSLQLFSLPVTQSPPHGYACLGQAHVMLLVRVHLCVVGVFGWRLPSHMSYLQRTNRDSHPDVRGLRKEMKRLRETFMGMKWTHSPWERTE